MRTGVKIALAAVVVVLLVLGLVVGVLIGGLLWLRNERVAEVAATGTHLLYEVQADPAGAAVLPGTTEEVLTILKRRIDPSARGSFVFRTAGKDCIEIIVPRPNAGTTAASKEFQEYLAYLDRMVTRPGMLEFRIAVAPTGEKPEVIAAARRSLHDSGPAAPPQPYLRWFAVEDGGRDNFPSYSFVLETWAGQPYVLLYDDAPHRLTRAAGSSKWSITHATLMDDPHSGNVALSFEFDAAGAALFGELTGSNVKHPMAILLDDRALSAPTIQDAITGGRGQITFGEVSPTHTAPMIRKQAESLRQILDAGALPVRLKRVP
jgi:preprotein translocase subunit SecD